MNIGARRELNISAPQKMNCSTNKEGGKGCPSTELSVLSLASFFFCAYWSLSGAGMLGDWLAGAISCPGGDMVGVCHRFSEGVTPCASFSHVPGVIRWGFATDFRRE